jgi:hypothetical protein
MQNLEKEFLASCNDVERFVSGNKSAGTRVRKYMQSIKKLAQEVRVEIQEQKNSVVA